MTIRYFKILDLFIVLTTGRKYKERMNIRIRQIQ